MFDQKDRHTGLIDFADQFDCFSCLGRVKTGHVFIQEQDFRLGCQSPGHFQTFLVRSAHFLGQDVSLFVQSGKLQDFDGTFRSFFPALCGSVAEIAGCDDVIENRQVLQRLHDLERTGNLHIRIFICPLVRNIFAVVIDLAFCRRIISADHVEGCGLSGTVRADHACDSAFADREGNIVDSGQTLESLGQADDFNYRFFGHDHFPPFLLS